MAKRGGIPFRGGAVTLLLIVLLVTPPAQLLDQVGAYADVRADVRTGAATAVAVRDGLTSDPAGTIPREFGAWTGTDDDSWPDALGDSLDYDSLLVRHYNRPGFYVPVQLMVLTAREAQAFHNPTVCFRYQDGIVAPLPDTDVEVAGATLAVGRMVVTYDQESKTESPKVVHNLYLVEEKFAAPVRTTWIRLSFSGADESTADQLLPFLDELMEHIAPHAFQGRDEHASTAAALQAWGGWPLASGAMAVAALPFAAEGLVLWRRRNR